MAWSGCERNALFSWLRLRVFILLLGIGLGLPLLAVERVLDLAPAEQAWVHAHPVIRIQMGDDSPPFEFRQDGVWQGMAYDVLREAVGSLGLRIEVTGMPWNRALLKVHDGHEVDLLLAVTRSPERERQMLLTRTYLSFPQVVFAAKSQPFAGGLQDLGQRRIAVESDYVMVDWLRRDLPQAILEQVATSGEALTAVATGKADAYVGNLAVGSYFIDHLGLVNLAVVAPTGYGDEQFAFGVRQDWPELVDLLDRALIAIPEARLHEIRQQWLSVRYEHGLRVADFVLWGLAIGTIALGLIIQLRRMVNQRTRELKDEIVLRQAKERHLAQAQRIADIGSWSKDFISGSVQWSDETKRILAWPAGKVIPDRACTEVVHPEDGARREQAKEEAMRGLGAVQIEYRIRRPDGSIRHLEERCQAVRNAQGEVIGLDGVVRDITAQREAEAERAALQQNMLHSEKMRVLGQLAGGIAHDFNNLLGGITGYAELLQRSLDRPDTAEVRSTRHLHAQRILTAAQRAAGITAQLRVFSRRDAVDLVPVDVHTLIRDACQLAGRGTTTALAIDLRLEAATAVVRGDAAQIETALVNLALNSRDAMPHGGTVTFRTALVELAAPVPGSHAFDLVPGRYLEIAVSDTGIGMDDEVLARLFEPFFTTKEAGLGTGLGLANVYACVKNHRGAIAVGSTVGQGTTFRLWLPLAATAVDQGRPATIHGAGRILVVDDDPDLRAMAAEILAILGYSVAVAADGVEAVACYSPEAFDLVLLDMMMPVLDGEQTIKRLRAINPAVRILLCSGSVEDEAAARAYGADAFIRKPYQLAILSQRIAALLPPSAR